MLLTYYSVNCVVNIIYSVYNIFILYLQLQCWLSRYKRFHVITSKNIRLTKYHNYDLKIEAYSIGLLISAYYFSCVPFAAELAASSTHAQLTGVVWSHVCSAFVPSLLPQITFVPLQFEYS